MKPSEPDFWVLDYVTITKEPRTGLVLGLGGTDEQAGILQRSGFLDAPGPRGSYHRLPHGLSVDQQRHRATAASHALLAAGHSVHLDPALNTLVSPDDERAAALRYLARFSKHAFNASGGDEVAAILTEIAEPAQGLLPLLREAVVGARFAWADGLRAIGEDPEFALHLGNTTETLSRAADQILIARNQAARTADRPAPSKTPPSPARLPPPDTPRRR